MANKIQIKRGAFASLPALSVAEFGFSTDTFQVHIGNGGTNYEVLMHQIYDAGTFLYATDDNTPAVKTRAEVMGLLSGQATADFAIGNKITDLTNPTDNQDAATKYYVDTMASGLNIKAACDVATAAVLAACTAAGSGVGKTLTGNAVGILTVDDVATVLDDRILVKDQAAGDDNGIYKVTTEGTAGVAFVLTRSTDADEDVEVTAGMFTFVSEGTVSADQGWVLSTNDPITVDTTVLNFSQFSGAGTITAGDGMTKTGDTLNVIGGTGITANADDIEVDYGSTASTACVGNDARLSDARTPTAHKDSHDPNGGSDALDTAVAAEISVVVAAGIGTSHSFSRADHIHAITHSIIDNHIITIDGTTNQPVDNDFAKFTTNGLEGRSYSEVMGDLSGTATADFAMNTHKITGVVDPGANQDVATKKYVDDQVATADTFLELTDTPANYTDNGLDILRVNTGETAVELVAFTTTYLDDTAHGTDALTTKAATSNILYDHDHATTGVHGAGANTLLHSASDIDGGTW